MQLPNDENKNKNETPDGQHPKPPEWQKWVLPAMVMLVLLWVMAQFSGFGMLDTGGTEILYSDLLREARLGNIAQITIRGNDASGEFDSPIMIQAKSGARTSLEQVAQFSAMLPTDHDQLLTLLEESTREVRIKYESASSPTLLVILLNLLPFVLLVGFLIWIARRAQRQMNGAIGFGRTQAREYTVDRPQVTFDDVAGQDSAKAELTEIIDFLKEPDKYIALGARIPRGVLLVGPPGTGKTLMARAVAGEASVSFFSIAASEFVEMFVGVGASRVRDLFKRAKENAPSIVFIDELDAVGRRRGAGLGGSHDEREQTLNQMLAEMDGFDQNESVIVMAATNRNDVLDPALLRPGRFDRQVTVGLPNKTGRLAILKIHTRGKPLANDVSLESMARGTIGFSGADLANLANEAALTTARRNAKKISNRDFSDAFDRILLGSESPPLSDPMERKVTAYHEAGHALIAAITPEADPVLKVTIIPRGHALGVTATMPNDDRRNYPKKYLHARVLVYLGGRAAEHIVFNELTTGAENDLRHVTEITRRMVAQLGMSDAIGPINFGDDERQPFLGYSLSQGRNYSEETAAQIDAEVRRMVEEAYQETLEIIRSNRDKLEAIAQALLENEVIEQDELLQILGMGIDDILPEDPEEAERIRKKLQTGHHFTVNLRKEATDEGIIGEDNNDSKNEDEAIAPPEVALTPGEDGNSPKSNTQN